jgi:hypothetical protein
LISKSIRESLCVRSLQEIWYNSWKETKLAYNCLSQVCNLKHEISEAHASTVKEKTDCSECGSVGVFEPQVWLEL